MRIPKAQRLLQSLMFDTRIKAFEKFLLLVLPMQPPNADGSFQVSARKLALISGSTEKTVSRGLRNLAQVGYIEVAESNSSSRGGFRIFFRSVSLLAIMLGMMSGGSAALHKTNYTDTSARNNVSLHIIRQRKRKRVTKDIASEDHKWFLENRRRVQHPLGQLAPTIQPSSAA
jgi:hypothetical protein